MMTNKHALVVYMMYKKQLSMLYQKYVLYKFCGLTNECSRLHLCPVIDTATIILVVDIIVHTFLYKLNKSQ